MLRSEAGPCPGRTDHDHQWIEATALNEAGLVERYVCGFCNAKADELTDLGAERVRAGWMPPNGPASFPLVGKSGQLVGKVSSSD